MHRALLATLQQHHDLALVTDGSGRVRHGIADPSVPGLFERVPETGDGLFECLVCRFRARFEGALGQAAREGRASFELYLDGPPRAFTVEVARADDELFAILVDAVGTPDPLRGAAVVDPGDFLRDTLSRLTLGVIIQGPSAEILMANQAALELLGLTEAELLGRTSFDPQWRCFDADGSTIAADDLPVPRALRTRRPVRAVAMGVDRPGDLGRIWLRVDAIPVLDAGGELSHVVCSFADVSAEHLAHAALEREHSILSEVMYTSVTGITVLDSRGEVTFANRAAEEILGLDSAEMTGRAYNAPEWKVTAIDGGPWPDERLPVSIVLATKRPVLDVRFAIEWPDGTRRAISVNGAPVLGRDGEVERVVTSFVDITEQVREAAEREHLQREMESLARLDSLSVLAGGVAHDFNNVLVGILSSAELMSLELPEGHPARGLAELVEQSAQRAAELTRQLMAFSGRATFDQQPIDVSTCLKETAQLLQALLSKDVRLVLDLAEGLPAISADPLQIRQMATNVVLNASQAYGDRAGTVRVRTAHVVDFEQAEAIQGVVVEGDPAPPFVVIEIADDGPGMAPEVVGRIFEPFFTTKATGHGLGLAAVRGVVRSFGGFVNVESAPGRGTTFRFGFPRAAERARDEERRPEGLVPSLGGTVLVIDDEQVVRRVVSAVLRDLGCDVLTATDGIHGLETFDREFDRITAAVVDVNMPRMNGDKVIRKLRERAPDLPILLMSGRLDHELEPIDELQAFMPKPFRRAELATALGRLVSRTRT